MEQLPKGARKHCNRIVDGTHEKRCSACHDWYPATRQYFHVKSGATLHSTCCSCTLPVARVKNKARYEATKAGHATPTFQRFDASALAAAMGAPK
jgi:hypothetical protein